MKKVRYNSGKEAFYNLIGVHGPGENSETTWGYNFYFKSTNDLQTFAGLNPDAPIEVDGGKIRFFDFNEKIFSKSINIKISEHQKKLEESL